MNPATHDATCSRCRLTKPASDFYAHPKNRNGLQNACKACNQANYQANRAARIEQVRQHRWEDQRVRMASDARRRDRAAGRVSTIEAKDIVIPEVCPVTGGPLWHGVGEPAWMVPVPGAH